MTGEIHVVHGNVVFRAFRRNRLFKKKKEEEMKKKEKESENSGRITGDTQARMLPGCGPASFLPR